MGAKTPFAYADQFSIETRVDGTHRTYSAFLDETQKGSVALLSEQPTTECNGTTIVLPVKAGDVDRFRAAVSKACHYWSVRPEVKGLEWGQDRKPFMRGENWHARESHRGEFVILIDGIAYAVPNPEVFPNRYSQQSGGRLADDNGENAESLVLESRVTLFLEYPNGEISLAASREAIHWTPETITKVRKRAREVCRGIVATIRAEVEAHTTWIDAANYRETVKHFRVDNLQWRGLELWTSHYFDRDSARYDISRNAISPEVEPAQVERLNITGRRKRYVQGQRVSGDNNEPYTIGETCILIVEDIHGNVTNAMIARAMSHTPMSFTRAYRIGDCTSYRDTPLSHLPHIRLSEIAPDSVAPVVGERKGAKRLLYRYSGSSWDVCPASEFKASTSTKVRVKLGERSNYGDRAMRAVEGQCGGAWTTLVNAGVEVYGWQDDEEVDYSPFAKKTTPIVDYLGALLAKENLKELGSYHLHYERPQYPQQGIIGLENGMRDEFERIAAGVKGEGKAALLRYVQGCDESTQLKARADVVHVYLSALNERKYMPDGVWGDIEGVSPTWIVKANAARTELLKRYPLLSLASAGEAKDWARYVNLIDG